MLEGEQQAFDEFFNTYAQRLAIFAARRCRLGEAVIEDIVQSTLIKAMRSVARFRGEAALFSWLCGICRHELVDQHRKAARQPLQQSIDAFPRDDLLELRMSAELEPSGEH
jgi:RNA polymerase sigma-70 factor (ECF subfamily)